MKKANKSQKTRVVALVYDGLCTFEYGIATEVFGLDRPEIGGNPYHFVSVSLEKHLIKASGGLMVKATGGIKDLYNANIVVIPGWRGTNEPVPENLQKALITAHKRGARLLSICSGVYVLAAAGLLKNKTVTTHWRYANDFAEKFPDVTMQANSLYVDNGDIVTSAGSSAGIDACLHIVRNDFGAKVANSIARRLVMHAHRQGDQAQFIEQPVPKERTSHTLSKLMDDVLRELNNKHTILSMAKSAAMTPRTFQRRFLSLTGSPPMEWLNQERVSRACQLLETSHLRIDEISDSVGFANAEAMRYHFRRQLSIGPAAYRKIFNT